MDRDPPSARDRGSDWRSGVEGEWAWVHCPELGTSGLVDRWPEIVEGRRLVVTAFDSDVPRVGEEELQRGWVGTSGTIVTVPIASSEEFYWVLSALSDDGSEAWVFDAHATVPDFGDWSHLAGWPDSIDLDPPEVAIPDPPPTLDRDLIDQQRVWLAERQAELRAGLARYRPLTFLRDALLVTRDPLVRAAIEAR